MSLQLNGLHDSPTGAHHQPLVLFWRATIVTLIPAQSSTLWLLGIPALKINHAKRDLTAQLIQSVTTAHLKGNLKRRVSASIRGPIWRGQGGGGVAGTCIPPNAMLILLGEERSGGVKGVGLIEVLFLRFQRGKPWAAWYWYGRACPLLEPEESPESAWYWVCERAAPGAMPSLQPSHSCCPSPEAII